MVILIEGFDGTGKTTLTKGLQQELGAALFPTPSGSRLGQFIREIQDLTPLVDAAMLHLYVADQLDNERHVKTAIDAGHHVVFDRHCMTSGPAYRPLEWSIFRPIFLMAKTFVQPDIGIVLAAEPEVVMRRLSAGGHPCRWTPDQIEAISARTVDLVQSFAKKTVVVDAHEAPALVRQNVYAKIASALAALP